MSTRKKQFFLTGFSWSHLYQWCYLETKFLDFFHFISFFAFLWVFSHPSFLHQTMKDSWYRGWYTMMPLLQTWESISSSVASWSICDQIWRIWSFKKGSGLQKFWLVFFWSFSKKSKKIMNKKKCLISISTLSASLM